jgi:hypothetical protein
MANGSLVLLSCTAFSYVMNSMASTAKLLKPYTGADEAVLVSTLCFVYLMLFSSPAFSKLSRGANGSMNSSGILISWFTGKQSTMNFLRETVLCVTGTYFGLFLLALTLQVRVLPSYNTKLLTSVMIDAGVVLRAL